MDHKFKNLIKLAKKVSLEKKEKSDLRANLLNFLAANPVRRESAGRQLAQRSSIFRFLKPMPVIASLVLVALAGGGVSFAAENALPGDFLYPVKVNVNEEVRAALSLSAEAKADWEARRAERRLEEAETLAERGELKAENKERVESNFQRHAEKVRAHIAELEARADFKAAAHVSAKLENSLEAHERILDRFMSPESESVSAKVKAEAEHIVNIRSGIEAKISAEEATTTDEDKSDSQNENTELKLNVKEDIKKEATEQETKGRFMTPPPQ